MPDAPPTATTNAADALGPGDRVDQFEVVEQIGAGGTSVVFLGRDPILERRVAIKQVLAVAAADEDELRQRVRAEGAIYRRLASEHAEHLVRLIDVVDHPKGLLLVTEYVDGPSLEQVLTREGEPMDERRAMGYLAGIAQALHAIHAAGIVHRDLKPGNVLLPKAGGLKVSDFGLAASLGEQDALTEGTVRYLAPELLRGEPGDPRSDLYALGMIAYEMLAGRDKFEEAFRSVLRDRRNAAQRWVKWHTNPRTRATPLDELFPPIKVRGEAEADAHGDGNGHAQAAEAGAEEAEGGEGMTRRGGVRPAVAELVARLMEKEPAARVPSAEALLDAIRRLYTQPRAGDGAGQTSLNPDRAKAATGAAPTGDTPHPGGDTVPLPPAPSRLPNALVLTFSLLLSAAIVLGFVVAADSRANADRRQAHAVTALNAARLAHRGGDLDRADRQLTALAQAWPATTPFGGRVQRDLWLVQADAAHRQGDAPAEEAALRRLMKITSDDQATPIRERLREVMLHSDFDRRAQEILALARAGRDAQAQEMLRPYLRAQQRRTVNFTPEQQRSLDTITAAIARVRGSRSRLADLEAAQAAYRGGELNRAIDLLEQLQARLGDRDPEVLALLVPYRRELAYREAMTAATSAARGEQYLEAIEAYQRAASIRPSSQIDDRVRELRAREALARAKAALAEGRGDEAEAALTESLGLGVLPEAQELLAGMERNRAKAALVAEGESLVEAGEVEAGLAKLNQALAMEADEALGGRVRELSAGLAMAQATAAAEAGRFDDAEAALAQAEGLDPDVPGAYELRQQVQTQRAYQAQLARGDEALARGDFGPAKMAYRAAREIVDSDEARQRLQDAEYEHLLDQGRRLLDSANPEYARGPLDTAAKIRDTPRLRELLDRLERVAPRP